MCKFELYAPDQCLFVNLYSRNLFLHSVHRFLSVSSGKSEHNPFNEAIYNELKLDHEPFEGTFHHSVLKFQPGAVDEPGVSPSRGAEESILAFVYGTYSGTGFMLMSLKTGWKTTEKLCYVLLNGCVNDTENKHSHEKKHKVVLGFAFALSEQTVLAYFCFSQRGLSKEENKQSNLCSIGKEANTTLLQSPIWIFGVWFTVVMRSDVMGIALTRRAVLCFSVEIWATVR